MNFTGRAELSSMGSTGKMGRKRERENWHARGKDLSSVGPVAKLVWKSESRKRVGKKWPARLAALEQWESERGRERREERDGEGNDLGLLVLMAFGTNETLQSTLDPSNGGTINNSSADFIVPSGVWLFAGQIIGD